MCIVLLQIVVMYIQPFTAQILCTTACPKNGQIPWVGTEWNKVLDGSVDQSEQAFLTEEQIKEGFCLGTWMMADG